MPEAAGRLSAANGTPATTGDDVALPVGRLRWLGANDEEWADGIE